MTSAGRVTSGRRCRLNILWQSAVGDLCLEMLAGGGLRVRSLPAGARRKTHLYFISFSCLLSLTYFFLQRGGGIFFRGLLLLERRAASEGGESRSKKR